MSKAIIVGASSGIGRALARRMAADGWTLGLASRNEKAMKDLAADLGEGTAIQILDVRDTASVSRRLDALRSALGDVECVVISSGIGIFNNHLLWEPEGDTIATNVAGFAAVATWAGRHFLGRKKGHLVGLSSVASLRGSPFNPAYNASKAFVSNYLEGLRMNLGRFGVAVTDIRPGYIDTPMTQGQEGMFWVADVETCVKQIYRAMKKRRKVVYVPRRWALVSILSKIAPEFLYKRFSN